VFGPLIDVKLVARGHLQGYVQRFGHQAGKVTLPVREQVFINHRESPEGRNTRGGVVSGEW
jgi:hypothetical protein